MDAPQTAVVLADRRREKHRRFYEMHKEALRLAAHRRYFMSVHNISDPPPVRTYSTTAPSVPVV